MLLGHLKFMFVLAFHMIFRVSFQINLDYHYIIVHLPIIDKCYQVTGLHTRPESKHQHADKILKLLELCLSKNSFDAVLNVDTVLN